MDTIATAPPETPAQEYQRIAAEIHNLTEQTQHIETQAAKIRLSPNHPGSGMELERLRDQHAIITRQIQRLLPKYASLKFQLGQGR